MDGKTKTLSENQAIWLPDAMFERVKFELNLPSNARKYLEEYSDDFPNKSLVPSYPALTKTNERGIESVVMPRMVYDIWPYFVPFYPIYSKLLYPAINLAPYTTEFNFQMPTSMSLAPTYFRQIRCNQPTVNAECVNKSVIGSVLSPCELDEKIQQQIKKHEHLLRRSIKSRESSPECCTGCHCSKITQPSKSHQHHHHNHQQQQQNYHHQSDFSHSNNNETYNSDENKYYQFYQKMIQDLYESARMSDNASTRRSKSVTFCEKACCHPTVENKDHLDEYEVVCCKEKEFHKTISTNTDVSFGKSQAKPKKPTVFSKSPSRRHWKCYN